MEEREEARPPNSDQIFNYFTCVGQKEALEQGCSLTNPQIMQPLYLHMWE